MKNKDIGSRAGLSMYYQQLYEAIDVSVPPFCLPPCQLHLKAAFLCGHKMLPVANRATYFLSHISKGQEASPPVGEGKSLV